MKKKISLFIIVLMLFMGVVSASSINGDYQGMPIVKITSGEKVLETDEVPAFIYEGHTVVPISTLRQLGASVTWDAYGYSVDVKLPQMSETQNSAHADPELKRLKELSYAQEMYRRLMGVGDTVSSINEHINSAVRAITANDAFSGEYIDIAEQQFKLSGEFVEKWANDANANAPFKDNNDLLDAKPIIFGYSEIIHQYNDALNNLYQYAKTRDPMYADNIFAILDKTRTDIQPIMTKAYSKHFEYFNNIQNY